MSMRNDHDAESRNLLQTHSVSEAPSGAVRIVIVKGVSLQPHE